MTKQKNNKNNAMMLILKGCCMGAADVVPGVSGGTIAFITGIYEKLINSIKSIDFDAIKLLFSLKFKSFWTKINGNFLVCILLGIMISIFSLAKAMTYLLENEPIAVWSFFFGLIIASAILVAKEIKHWDIFTIISLLAGIATAYTITILSPSQTPETWWFIMLSGSIAICAMILPGISGAFILLLLGKYSFLINAVSNFDILVIAIFGIGAIVGIISFSHVLSWLLKNFHTLTVALLTGFMVGSLNKVWPWKITLESYTDRNGISRSLVEQNILPSSFEGNSQIATAVIMCAIGLLLIWSIEYTAHKLKK